MLSHTKVFQDSLFSEMRSRIKEDDASVPYKLDDYFYYNRFEQGGEYAIYCRKKGSLEAPEEIIVDGNELGKDKSFFNFYISVSPDHQKVAVLMDTVGRNFYTIMVKDLNTGSFLSDQIDNTRGGIEWMNDNLSFFYSVPDPITLRQYLIKHHAIGQNQEIDQLVFEEKDETLSVYLGKTRSEQYITLTSGRTDASVVRFMSADKMETPKLIQPLTENVNYSVDHAFGDELLIYTNKDAVNYKIVKASVKTPSVWMDFVPHRPDVFLQGVTYFNDYYVLEERSKGLTNIQLVRWSDGDSHYLQFDEPAYYAGVSTNPEFNSTTLRFIYTSMTTPSSTFDYEMGKREKTLMKEQPVLGDFDKNNYATERVMVTARDGKQVPMSIVYRKDKFKKDGTMPGWIYSYGSYGISMEATFNSNRISLLDRGFVYAIAHIRGGQEMGGDWYEDGKMMNKKNTFYDFIDCSKWLQDNNYVAKDKLFASGGSAGGLLIGAVINMAPELYRGVIAAVPFVDVITTMMDETIPLTTFEWLEWGNPNIQEQYEYMLSYSPYDNVEAKAYPHMLVTAGLHDSQVQYWEPAKWVALLRTKKTDQNNLFFYTNMEAGHGGASGRFRRLKEIAREYAFVFDILNIRS
jgi:oligopeptidase B